ncbi:MAG: hypothetical protein M3406_10260 [Chloroflexota bacterium]|nr:hypothetical protein [Chloroflexota bacterium]
MSPLIWLVAAVLAGSAGYLVAWPAWQSYRSRESRDLNAERYLAWRGRAVRREGRDLREGMTGEERRRIYAGVALLAAGAVALVAFFVTS